jgi:hypothetical protein
VLDALMLLMDRIQNGRGHSQIAAKREELIASRNEE